MLVGIDHRIQAERLLQDSRELKAVLRQITSAGWEGGYQSNTIYDACRLCDVLFCAFEVLIMSSGA